MTKNELIEKYRTPEAPVDPIFVHRWSPRAMSSKPMTHEELFTLFEAARWAPSSYNNQPWRFLYARRGTENWETFFKLLVPGNQAWCKNASVLLVLISKTTFDHSGKPARTHSLDTGAAWENFALQGSLLGLVVHGMQGFNYDDARKVLAIPEEYQVECMIAVGLPGEKKELPPELQERENPTPRKKIAEIVIEGKFRL